MEVDIDESWELTKINLTLDETELKMVKSGIFTTIKVPLL